MPLARRRRPRQRSSQPQHPSQPQRTGQRGGPRLRQRVLLIAVAVPALLAGCVAGPAERPAVIERDEPGDPQRAPSAEEEPALPPLEEPTGATIDWDPCDDQGRERLADLDHGLDDSVELSCATASSEIDPPGLPGEGTLRVSLLRVGTGDVPLVVLGDAAGEPGSAEAARLAAELPEEVLEEVSLVGLDRRYTGQSRPNACIPEDVREDMAGFDPEFSDIAPLLDTVGRAGQECTIALGNEQGALDSWRSAGDLESVREQLGVPALHAIATGDGSRVLERYAQRFPDQVGRFVHDGVPDPTGDEVTRMEGIAEGAEATLEAFAEDCRAQDDCPLEDPDAAVGELTDELAGSPLPGAEDRDIGPGLALHAISSGLAQRDRWPELAVAVEDALDGDGAGLDEFVAPLLDETSDGPPRLDTGWATRCNDTQTREPPERLNEIGEQWREDYPHFGGLMATRLAWCTPWPVGADERDDEVAGDVPPILVLHTAADPVTPETGTERGAMRMPTSVSVEWQGAGHGALGHSQCATEHALDFLLDGEIPQDGTPCPA